MDVMDAARALGVAIQADDKYKAFLAAQETAGKDESLAAFAKELQDMQGEFEALMENADRTEDDLNEIQQRYIAKYQEMNEVPSMAALQDARAAVNDMMNDAMQIIYLSVNGEDPMTCQPSEETMQQIQGQMLSM